MIAVFKLASAFAYFLLGWLGRYYEPLGPVRYWMLTAVLPLAGLAFLLLTRRSVTRVLEAGARAAADATRARESAAAVRHLEAAVLGAQWTEGVVLRYGAFYGPGTGLSAGGE